MTFVALVGGHGRTNAMGDVPRSGTYDMGVSLLYVSNCGGEALDAFADVIEGGGAEAQADGVSGGGAGRIGAVAVGSGNVKHAFANGLLEERAVAAGVDVWREGEPDV